MNKNMEEFISDLAKGILYDAEAEYKGRADLAMAHAMKTAETLVFNLLVQLAARANPMFLGFNKDLSREEKQELFKERANGIVENLMDRIDMVIGEELNDRLNTIADEFVI